MCWKWSTAINAGIQKRNLKLSFIATAYTACKLNIIASASNTRKFTAHLGTEPCKQ